MTDFITFADHIEAGKRSTLVMFDRPDADQLAMLVMPVTYCPNVAGHLDESNWEAIKATLSEADPNGNDHEVVSFGHWATPYDLMLVRPNTPAHEAAQELADRLEDYPVLDEHDFSSRECESQYESVLESLGRLDLESDGEPLNNNALNDLADQICQASNETRDYDESDVTEALGRLGWVLDAANEVWRG
jgi:hypothetical protein